MTPGVPLSWCTQYAITGHENNSMGLSKEHLNNNDVAVTFDPDLLAGRLKSELAEVSFCLLMGSAKDGVVQPRSDLDLAFYTDGKPGLDFFVRAEKIVGDAVPGVRCDIGILNRAEPIFQFESLKGRLLFARDMKKYAGFFSLACRQYESQIADYKRQLTYRLEAHGEI